MKVVCGDVLGLLAAAELVEAVAEDAVVVAARREDAVPVGRADVGPCVGPADYLTSVGWPSTYLAWASTRLTVSDFRSKVNAAGARDARRI